MAASVAESDIANFSRLCAQPSSDSSHERQMPVSGPGAKLASMSAASMPCIRYAFLDSATRASNMRTSLGRGSFIWYILFSM